MSSSLGERIKAARKAAKLTQAELAEKLGIRNTTISNWEKGISRPDTDQLERLCWELGVQPNYFFFDQLADTVDTVMRAMPGYVDPMSMVTPEEGVEPELVEYLADLRDRPETRALLEASRGMTKEQVEAMANFAKQLRGDSIDD